MENWTWFAETVVPRDIALPLPVDAEVLRSLLIPLFLLHILFVNLMVGGTILATLFEWMGYLQRESKWDRLAEKIAETVTVNKSMAVVLGVGPLLIVNLLYTLTFYSSNALTGHAWILIVPLVTLAFLLTYLHKYTWNRCESGVWKLLHIWVGMLSTFLFLTIPFIFLGNVNLMNYPDKWYDVQGFFSALNIGNGNVYFRYLHFVVASIAVTSLFLCMWLTYSQRVRNMLPEGFTAPGIRRTFYSIAFYVTMAQFVIGPTLLLVLPRVGLSTFMLSAILTGACLGVVLLVLMKIEINASDERIGRLWLPIYFVFLFVAFSMGAGRQQYRDNSLQSFNVAVAQRTAAFRHEVDMFNVEFAKGMAGPQSGEQLFKMVCASCHQVDVAKAAPTLKEIYELHKDKPEEIVAWATAPGYKRKQFNKMPPMAHLGQDKLALIADYMLEIGSGKKELVIDDSNWIRTLDPDAVAQTAAEASGDANAGAALFVSQTCVSCHRSVDGAKPIGPPLEGIAKRLKKEEIIESILKPSAKIAEGYESWSLLTFDGQVLTGMIVEENEDEGTLKLRQPDGKIIELLEDDIDGMKKQDLSTMPAGVVDNISPEQLADLVAYLQSLEK
ncbi:c-type cytochrome [Blastopirellula sp. JC732]|uniref:C-type cytochrome n=1 Tax=Blastopirellula sediminis TaxID=2894196 RepID=A0A9X1MI13_9BACT|nr:c-type cytochrome [Blastopirellula sediminis]MCC9607724.1 c-type cytochrome [Blastopirellula sediminis]MCC9627483.1 c-type cytochrome [Blastopirellula sediminis]